MELLGENLHYGMLLLKPNKGKVGRMWCHWCVCGIVEKVKGGYRIQPKIPANHLFVLRIHHA